MITMGKILLLCILSNSVFCSRGAKGWIHNSCYTCVGFRGTLWRYELILIELNGALFISLLPGVYTDTVLTFIMIRVSLFIYLDPLVFFLTPILTLSLSPLLPSTLSHFYPAPHHHLLPHFTPRFLSIQKLSLWSTVRRLVAPLV
jgi:hypothetical protein